MQLTEPYNSLGFWLIGLRADITFTNSLFLTTFVQYNEQADNVNLNLVFSGALHQFRICLLCTQTTISQQGLLLKTGQ
jgi:hypothetical protein